MAPQRVSQVPLTGTKVKGTAHADLPREIINQRMDGQRGDSPSGGEIGGMGARRDRFFKVQGEMTDVEESTVEGCLLRSTISLFLDR